MGFVRHIHPELSLAKIALGLLITLILIVNIGSIRALASDTTITYAMPVTFAAIPAYVAAEKGFWADEGLNVKVQMFSAGRLALDALLSGNAQVMSVSETPLHILSLQPPNMVSALVRGDIAGYFAWEPHIYYGRQQLGDNAIVIGPDDLYHGRHCIAMNQDFVQKNPEVVVKLLKGLVKAQDYVHEHAEDAKAIVAKYTNTNTALIGSLWPEYDVRVELGRELLDILGDEAKWVMTQSGSTGDLPQLRNFIYTDGLLAVRPESVTIH